MTNARMSPTLRRMELARRLRALRETSGKSLEDVAGELLCSPSKISRIETGARGASARDVRDLCRIYAVPEDTQHYLMDLAREAKQRGWWQAFDEVVSDYTMLMGLEAGASAIHQYETVLVPGLLQTVDYSRALMRRISPAVSDDAAEQYVISRQERQQRLFGDDPPEYWAIMDEAAVRRQVGGVKVMNDQIEHLIRCAEEHRVILQIIPFLAGAHPGMEGNFEMLHYEDAVSTDVVYVEGRAGNLFLHREADLRLHRQTFDHLRATAESPDHTIDRLQRIIDDCQ